MPERYSIRSETHGAVEVFSLHDAGRASAEIVPEWGNNCFRFQTDKSVLEEVPFEEFEQRPGSYGIPILFPFPNRVRNGEFSYRGRRFRVDPPRHGFVRDKRWRVIDTGTSDERGAWIHCRVEASDYPAQILEQFPFPFRLDVVYRLHDGSLEMKTIVTNTGDKDLPFGFGIHPYFRLPEEGTLQVPANQYWELIEALPTGSLRAVEAQYDLRQPADLSRLSLDDIFTGLPESGRVQCLLSDRKEKIETVVEFDEKEFPHVVVYTAPVPRKAICIEPYTCPTDVFNLHDRGVDSNLIELPPDQENTFTVRFYTKPLLKR